MGQRGEGAALPGTINIGVWGKDTMATLLKDRTDVQRAARDLIYRGCLLLDEERFTDFLSLCDTDFRYYIKAYSIEIRRDMTWLEKSHQEFASMIEMLPRHNTDHGRLTRHATVYTVEEEGRGMARAVTSFVCYRTMVDGINSHLDAGETQLFAVGKYFDRIRIDGAEPKLVERVARLETLRLDKGSHYPV
jgi:methanesulfonate monooxygenase small subunit